MQLKLVGTLSRTTKKLRVQFPVRAHNGLQVCARLGCMREATNGCHSHHRFSLSQNNKNISSEDFFFKVHNEQPLSQYIETGDRPWVTRPANGTPIAQCHPELSHSQPTLSPELCGKSQLRGNQPGRSALGPWASRLSHLSATLPEVGVASCLQ